MADSRRVQLAQLAVLVVLGILVCALPVRELTGPVGTDATNTAITDSARVPVFLWCLGWWGMVFAGFRVATVLRVIWTLGCLTCLLHIAVAFHLGHGWSHEAAWEHTRQVGGYGDGIYVNYLFALVWLVYVVWMWVALDLYLATPRWLHFTIHGFLAFVVINAAVIFGSWSARLHFFVLFVLYPLLVVWLLHRRGARQAADASEPPSAE